MREWLAATVVWAFAGVAIAQPSQATREALQLYPKAALAMGMDGRVELTCERSSRLELHDCRVFVETPAGEGFGAAALAASAMSPPNPDVTAPPAKDVFVEYLFCARPTAAVTPDPREPQHLIVPATIDRRPTDAEIAAAFPAAAKAAGVPGATVSLSCRVTPDGALVDCRAPFVYPPTEGFGDAALSLVPLYHATPASRDGKPVPVTAGFTLTFGAPTPLPPARRAPPSSDCARRGAGDAAVAVAATPPPPPPPPGLGLPPPRIIASPQRISGPSADDVQRVYPRAALRAGVGGEATLRCTITPAGQLADCAVQDEDPPGQGFGPAALKLAAMVTYAPIPAPMPHPIRFKFVPKN